MGEHVSLYLRNYITFCICICSICICCFFCCAPKTRSNWFCVATPHLPALPFALWSRRLPPFGFFSPIRIAYCFYLDISRFSTLLCFFSKQFFLQFHFAFCANISINCPIVQTKTVPSTTMSTQSVESANASENQIRIRIGIGIEKPKVNLK